MIVTFIRTLIIFVTLVVVMRLMGKRQIGEMQPFEFIVTLIVADLACVPMADVSIPLTYGIVAILALFLLHQLLSFLEQSSDFFKHVISGRPSVVINKYGVDLKELKKNNMGLDDLIESMRNSGYFSFDDLDYAIFESNGQLSALENPARAEKPASVPVLIVNNGKAMKKNIALLHSDERSVAQFIKNQGGSVKNTEVMTVDGNGRTYLKIKNKKFRITKFALAEGTKW